MTPALECKNLSFGFPDRALFHDLNLTVSQGEFTVLIGPNGGGKTTLLRLALGFLKPDSGSIAVLGDVPKAGRPIGYVPQNVTGSEDLPLTLFTVTLMGRVTPQSGRWTEEDKSCAMEALEQMGLADLRNKRFKELSIGQRQRGLIARALAGRPQLLLLDEPLSSVDPGAREQIVECLKKAHRTATVMMVSHDLTVIPNCATSLAYVSGDVEYWRGDQLTGRLLEELHRRSCSFCSTVRAREESGV